MNNFKKSISAGLGLAISLVGGLAQAQQTCDKTTVYGSYTLECNLSINKVPANKAIVLGVNAENNVAGSNPRVKVIVLLGNKVVKAWYTPMTVVINKDSAPYVLNKTFSYTKGGVGVSNYTSTISVVSSKNVVGRLRVTSNL